VILNDYITELEKIRDLNPEAGEAEVVNEQDEEMESPEWFPANKDEPAVVVISTTGL